jgi:AcrR family transcriptional regulator
MARPRGFDADAALYAAERQFAKSGYAGTSIDDIAEATGLGRGSLYAAFGDKHDLFLRGLANYCERREAEVKEALDGPVDKAMDRLRSFVLSAASMVAKDDDNVGCMASRFAVELGGSDPDAARRIKAEFKTIQIALRVCVEAAQENGDIDPAASSVDLARQLWATARGLEVLAAGGESVKHLEAAARSALAGLPRPETAAVS